MSAVSGSLRAGVVVAALASAGDGSPARWDPARPTPRVAELRRIHEALRQRLERLVRNDPLLNEARAGGGEVILAIRAGLLEQVLQEVARRYLDRVVLDFAPGLEVHASGELRTKTPLGRITAGVWRVDLTFHRLRGVLHARTPRLGFAGANRVHLVLPVALEEARGSATVRFKWDARFVASVVCGDFELTRRIEGTVLPQEYPVAGELRLSAASDAVVAQPAFPDRRFRLRVELSRESWTEIREAIESQDRLLRCGLVLDPEDLLGRLRKMARRGFAFRLPRSLFRTVVLPASVQRSVQVEDRRIDLSVRPAALRVGPDALWYSATVRSGVRPAAEEVAPPARSVPNPRDPAAGAGLR